MGWWGGGVGEAVEEPGSRQYGSLMVHLGHFLIFCTRTLLNDHH